MIHFANVTKNYAKGFQALSEVNFDLKQGDMAFLTGHSGAGKSTVLKLIMRMETLTSGQILVNGKDISKLSSKKLQYQRRRIGIVAQTPFLLGQQSAFDNVALPLIIFGVRHQEIAKRVRAALDKVGLLRKEKLLPEQLSSGEQQRVGLARAVVNKPEILLADEPTGNLDPGLSREIMNIFEQFNQVGVTTLIATHDLILIATLKHRILTLKDGRLINGENDAN